MLFPLFQYIKYLFSSFHLHGIHSPFVFKFNRDVLQCKDRYYVFDEIESLRAALLLVNRKIEHHDFGAGGKLNGKKSKSIASIAKKSSKKPKHAQLLFRMVKFANAKNILELGTNLGISSAYLATATAGSNVTSIEGCPNLAKVAKLNFKKLNINNIKVEVGNFDVELPKILKTKTPLDFIFIDGNHTKEATLRYFYLCLAQIHNDSILVFDDIHWSKGMQEAWKEIKSCEKVAISIDLFQMGIVFFRKGQEKEDFTIHH